MGVIINAGRSVAAGASSGASAGLWGAIASSGIGLLGNIFNGLFSSSQQEKEFLQQKELMKYSHDLGLENMDYQQKLAHQTFDYTQGREASLNQRLMENSPTIQKQAMIDAGINPASQFGTFSGNLAQASAPTYTPQAGAPSVPQHENFNFASGFASLADLVANIQLKKAQARKLNAESEGDELENAGKKEVNELVSSAEVSRSSDGNILISWKKNAKTKEGWQFKNEFRRWKTEINELDAKDLQAQFQSKVTQLKLDNDGILQAAAEMESTQFQKMCEEILNLQSVRNLTNEKVKETQGNIQLQIDEHEMRELEYDIKKHTNLYEVIKQLGNADVPWYEKATMIIAGIIATISR